ncbi:molybdopterin synthase sulfur carrier subunit [Fontimonas thermophila]|uniref:Molybdopterin synthase sulfur carrier subunit n=1 Tax=Fontimonas thermophila TaxID=1076937 RepID=A0A1I2H674_9GAMM|nr:MoaD/ThiS family protein [Fontimonas thermophila]SFF24141.1 molybdopterin synthase sulfur carrier subunit [Fontimonas thermophila]
MQIAVHCYGATRLHTGSDTLMLSLPEPATVADALAALASRSEAFAALLKQCAVAIGDELVRRTHPLKPGDELALLPPVAGG